MKNNLCLVCGYDELFEPPYDEEGTASDEICPCCGFHFGYDDDGLDESVYTLWRNKWLSSGCNWFSRGRKAPMNWNPQQQVKRVLKEI